MEIISRQEAIRKGLDRYYTGKACSKGHFSQRHTARRFCIQCSIEERENPEYKLKMKEYSKKHHEKHREERNKRSRERGRKNKELVRERSRAWYKANKEKHNKRNSLWFKNNRKRANEISSKWRELNPLKVRAINQNRRSNLKNAKGRHTKEDLKKIMSMQNHKCAACRKSLKNTKYEIDHIIPISKGGENAASNLQMLCMPCNRSKGAKMPVDFYQERGFLL